MKRQVIDFSIVGKQPTKTVYEFAFIIQLDSNFLQGAIFYLKRNIIESIDTFLPLIENLQTSIYEFFDIGTKRNFIIQS